MVIFDQINLMPTLSIGGNKFLNLAPWYFCILGKTISRWSTWSWPIMQKYSQMILIKVQSGNLITETRSTPKMQFHKLTVFGKQKILRGVIYFGHLTQILVLPNSKMWFMRPFDQTLGMQNLFSEQKPISVWNQRCFALTELLEDWLYVPWA